MITNLQRVDNFRSKIIARIGRVQPQLAANLNEMVGALPWYTIRNEAETDTAEVFVYDEIGGSFGVSADEFVKDLSEIDAKNIDVRINSPGGSLFDGIAIRNALEKHPAYVRSWIDGVAASAASIVAMGGNEVIMMPGSQLMIHDALGVEVGNAREMAAMSAFLDRQSDNIADLYAAKAGGTREEWRSKMLAETWYFPNEALDAKLADKVYVRPKSDEAEEEEETEEDTTVDVAALMNTHHDLSQYRYKYAGRNEAPAPTASYDYDALANVLRSIRKR